MKGFYVQAVAMSVAGGTSYAVCWWALDTLGFGHGPVNGFSLGFSFAAGIATGLIVEHRRWLRALDEKIHDLRSGGRS